MDKLHWKSATEIARLIREKKVTASDVLEHFLTRVRELQRRWLADDLGRSSPEGQRDQR